MEENLLFQNIEFIWGDIFLKVKPHVVFLKFVIWRRMSIFQTKYIVGYLLLLLVKISK